MISIDGILFNNYWVRCKARDNQWITNWTDSHFIWAVELDVYWFTSASEGYHVKLIIQLQRLIYRVIIESSGHFLLKENPIKRWVQKAYIHSHIKIQLNNATIEVLD